MKNKALIAVLLLVSQFVAAQQRKIDSVKKLYVSTTVDTLKIKYAYRLSQLLQFDKSADALRYTNEGLRIAERLNRPTDVAFGKGLLASVYGNDGNYPLSIKNALECARISDRIHNSRMLIIAYDVLGAIYDDQNEEQKAIDYNQKEIEWAKKRNERSLLVTAYYHQSYYYNKLLQPQQALVYAKLAEALAGQLNNGLLKGEAYAGLGHSYLLLKEPAIGLPFLHRAFSLLKTGDPGPQLDAYTFTADYYVIAGPRDSAIRYLEKQMELARHIPYEVGIMDAATKLGKQYDGHDQAKATYYYRTALELNQQLFATEKTRAFQNLVEADEQQRKEQAEQQRAAEEERKENLQLIAIALFIPVFIIVLFRLRRTRLHRRVIDFMGVLSLLLIFEFITLLSHPFIERITGHTPVLELIILVVVASILVPAHHQLTHWLKERLAKPYGHK